MNKELDYKPIRIQLMKYGINGYNQYGNLTKFDLCDTCYKNFCYYIKEQKMRKT